MIEGKEQHVWLSVRLERGLAEQVAQLARAQERKKSELVRWLLKRALARELGEQNGRKEGAHD